jgi:hypothetical protein
MPLYEFLSGAVYDINDRPSLVAANWPGFNNLDGVAQTAFVGFIMGLVFLHPANDLAV